MAEDVASPDSEWWDDWVSLEIDYSYTTPGTVSCYITIPWDWVLGSAGTFEIYSGPLLSPTAAGWWADDDIDTIVVGSNYNYNSWTQAQVDNVYFDSPDLIIPEPGSILALSAGLLGFAGLIRRRK